jgi:hypothetical protein
VGKYFFPGRKIKAVVISSGIRFSCDKAASAFPLLQEHVDFDIAAVKTVFPLLQNSLIHHLLKRVSAQSECLTGDCIMRGGGRVDQYTGGIHQTQAKF